VQNYLCIRRHRPKECVFLFLSSAFLQTGCESQFKTLRLNFEGLEKLKTWLDQNQWITKLLDSNFISVLRGVPLPRQPNDFQAIQALTKMVKIFLKTGRRVDFDRILKRLAESARRFLHIHLELVEDLERTLSYD